MDHNVIRSFSKSDAGALEGVSNSFPESMGIYGQLPVQTRSDASLPADAFKKEDITASSVNRTHRTKDQESLQRAETHAKEGIFRPSNLKKYISLLIWIVQDQWLLFGIGLVILIASQVQVPQSQQHAKEVIISYLSVSIIFFITGCTLPTRVLLANYSRWKLHLFVQIQCYMMTSAIAFGIASACAINKMFMDPWLLIGLIFGATVPTTISSNVVMTRQAGGNTALTVVESTIGNLLGPFLSPLLVSMYTSTGAWYTKVLPPGTDNYSEIYRRVFKQLGLSLLVPLFVGQIVRNVFPNATKTVFTTWKMNKISPVALLVLIWQTYDQAFSSNAWSTIKASNIVFIVFISIALFLLWLGICFGTAMLWLPRQDVIACCYCCPAKALVLLVPMSSIMYVNVSAQNTSKMQIPIVIYQGLQVAMGSILTLVFRRWMKAENERADERIKRAEGS